MGKPNSADKSDVNQRDRMSAQNTMLFSFLHGYVLREAMGAGRPGVVSTELGAVILDREEEAQTDAGQSADGLFMAGNCTTVTEIKMFLMLYTRKTSMSAGVQARTQTGCLCTADLPLLPQLC